MAKPETIKLTITLSKKTYVLGILSFNVKKEEFSYHFTYPSDAPKDHLNCDTGSLTAGFNPSVRYLPFSNVNFKTKRC
jgi:hypothetical protein